MNSIQPSILVVLMGSLGDVARGIAVAFDLKQVMPNCKITWLVEPACEELVRAHPSIDEVIVFQRPKGLRGVWNLAKSLRSRHFDICLDLQRHFKSGAFSYLSRAPRRIGFHRKDSKEGNWLFQTETIEQQAPKLSKLDHYRKFPEKLGANVNSVPRFGLQATEAKNKEVSNFIRSNARYVVAVLGSSWESKDWGNLEFQELLKDLLGTAHIPIALVGTKNHKDMGAELKGINEKRIYNFVGTTSLLDLCSLLEHCSAAVGPDSGPGHLSAALGKPYVSLFGPTDPERTAPYKSEHLVIRSKIGCSPCYLRKCPGLGKLCMRLIHPALVREKLLPLLQT